MQQSICAARFRGKIFARGAAISSILLPLPLPPRSTDAPRRAATGEQLSTCSPVDFNDIKHLARSIPADGLEAQDVVLPRCGCWVAHIAIFRRGDRFLGKAHTLGPPRPAFPALLAGAGRPLLPSMIDYSVFSQSAVARGSIISGPVSHSAMLSISAFRAKFGLRVIWLSAVRVGVPFS